MGPNHSRLPLAVKELLPHHREQIRKSHEAFYDDDDCCLFCGCYGPDNHHQLVMGPLPSGDYGIMSLHCRGCSPGNTTTCWQRERPE